MTKKNYETINSIYRKLKNKSFIAIKPPVELKKKATPLSVQK